MNYFSRSFSPLSLVFHSHVVSLSTIIVLFSMQLTISTDFSLAHFPHSCLFSACMSFHFPLACRFVKHHHHALFNATNYLYRFLSRSFSLLSLVFRLHVISLSTVIALFSMQQTISTDFSLAHFPHSRSFSAHTPFC